MNTFICKTNLKFTGTIFYILLFNRYYLLFIKLFCIFSPFFERYYLFEHLLLINNFSLFSEFPFPIELSFFSIAFQCSFFPKYIVSVATMMLVSATVAAINEQKLINWYFNTLIFAKKKKNNNENKKGFNFYCFKIARLN